MIVTIEIVELYEIMLCLLSIITAVGVVVINWRAIVKDKFVVPFFAACVSVVAIITSIPYDIYIMVMVILLAIWMIQVKQ